MDGRNSAGRESRIETEGEMKQHHLSKQTLNAIEAREAMMKIADRLEAVIEANQLNHATAFGDLLFLIRGEATQVKIDANKLLDKTN